MSNVASIVLRLLAAVANVLPHVIEWWNKRQAEKAFKKAQETADAISANPADEWMRKFNSDSDETSTADTTQPDEKQ